MQRGSICRIVCVLTAAALLLLPGCAKTPQESSGTSSAPDGSASAPAESGVSAAGFLPLDPIEKRERADGDLYTFSPHYAARMQPRDDYGAVLCYVGQSAHLDDNEDAWDIYGLTDSALRVLTPAIYSTCELREGVWFLTGNTPKAEDDPRVAKMYARSPQLENFYCQRVLVSQDGSTVLDDGYIYDYAFSGGYILFRTDGSLTVVDRRLRVIAELSGGDYCWVQTDMDGVLFAFHGFDGSVTVRDRTGKTLSTFTQEQIGYDVGYAFRGGSAPATQLFWYKGVGYVAHFDEGTGGCTVSHYLFAETGEVRTPPLAGYVSESSDYPPVPVDDSLPRVPELPAALAEKDIRCRMYDAFTGEARFVAVTERDGKEIAAVYDGDGKPLGLTLPLEKDVYDYFNVYGDYLYVECPGNRTRASVTAYYRLTDGECVFRYTAKPAA